MWYPFPKIKWFMFSFFKRLFSEKVDEKSLYEADLGSDIIESCLKKTPEEVKSYFQAILNAPPSVTSATGHPTVLFFIGVNGVGKTTTLAKLAHLLKAKGEKILIAACDTFRAAATEQLELWAGRLDVDLVKGKEASGVLFDSLSKAKAKGHTTVLVDTAGRLESKTDLMHELQKLIRIAKKFDAQAPHEVFLILDATLGQTTREQLRTFKAFAPITGLILTKCDGSAKGGTLISLYHEHKIPIRYLSAGETLTTLHPFDPATYLTALIN